MRYRARLSTAASHCWQSGQNQLRFGIAWLESLGYHLHVRIAISLNPLCSYWSLVTITTHTMSDQFAIPCSQAFTPTAGLAAFGTKKQVKNSATVSPMVPIKNSRMSAIVPPLPGHYQKNYLAKLIFTSPIMSSPVL